MLGCKGLGGLFMILVFLFLFCFVFFFCVCVNISWVESAISVAYVSSVGMGDYVSLNN